MKLQYEIAAGNVFFYDSMDKYRCMVMVGNIRFVCSRKNFDIMWSFINAVVGNVREEL